MVAYRSMPVLVLLLAACAAPARPSSRESFAGTWEVSVRDASGAPLPGHTIVAGQGPDGWSQRFPDRPPIPVRLIESEGGLLVFEAGPYESVLRLGVRATVLHVTRFTGDRSSGHMTAWYEGGTAPIPVLRARTEGRRIR